MTLKELIPDDFPRKRLKNYIAKTFASKLTLKVWEIDQTGIRIQKKKFSSGTYGDLRIGYYRIGCVDLIMAFKQIEITKKVTKQDIIQEVLSMNVCANCEHILKCYGCFFTKEKNFTEYGSICLEYMENGDLMHYNENHKLKIETKIMFLIQIAKGIRAIHQRNLAHRDIKLSNVLVSQSGQSIKICDFGTTKRVDKIEGSLVGNEIFFFFFFVKLFSLV